LKRLVAEQRRPSPSSRRTPAATDAIADGDFDRETCKRVLVERREHADVSSTGVAPLA